jgi:hypothetical protein
LVVICIGVRHDFTRGTFFPLPEIDFEHVPIFIKLPKRMVCTLTGKPLPHYRIGVPFAVFPGFKYFIISAW